MWKKDWFSNLPRFRTSHWDSLENCVNFITEIARDSYVNNVVEWKRVTTAMITKKGGLVYFLKLYLVLTIIKGIVEEV